MSDFSIEVYQPPSFPDAVVIRLKGNLDTYALPDLEKKVQELTKGSCRYLIVNCKDLSFLSSPGMGLFLATLGEMEKRGGGLVFAKVVSPEVHDAMNLLGFFDVFSIFEDEAEAIEKIQRKT